MFIAITQKGKEFFYKRGTMLKVPKSSASKIASALTNANYRLKEGQIWHAYSTEFMDEYMAGKAWIRKNKIGIRWN